jgi:hypothetical protein
MKRLALTSFVAVCGLVLNSTASAQGLQLDGPPAPSFGTDGIGQALAQGGGLGLQLDQPLPPAGDEQVLVNPQLQGVVIDPGLQGGLGQTQPAQVQQLVLDPSQPNSLAYFSPKLGARFLIEQVFLPQFGHFTAARIVSHPEQGSPLLQLNLQIGDVITRLDGLPANNLPELERHILETNVRFIRGGTQSVQQGEIFIQPNYWFVDPYAPVNPHCPHHCPQSALLP